MKVVIIGGSGFIGRKLADKLRSGGHQVVAASPSTGVNSLTGEGLQEALTGADVVVDVTNSPSFEVRSASVWLRGRAGSGDLHQSPYDPHRGNGGDDLGRA